jgi:hypothetical protein
LRTARSEAVTRSQLKQMIALDLTGLLSLVAYTSLSLSIKAMPHGETAAENLQELRVSQTI